MSSYVQEQLKKFDEELSALYNVRDIIYDSDTNSGYMAIPGSRVPVAFMPITVNTDGYMVPLGADYFADVSKDNAIKVVNSKIDIVSEKMSALSTMLPQESFYRDLPDSSDEIVEDGSEIVDLELRDDLPELETAEVFLDLTTEDRESILARLEALEAENPSISEAELDKLYFRMCQEKLEKKKEDEEMRANSIVGTVKLIEDIDIRPKTKPVSKEKKISLFKQRLMENQ